MRAYFFTFYISSFVKYDCRYRPILLADCRTWTYQTKSIIALRSKPCWGMPFCRRLNLRQGCRRCPNRCPRFALAVRMISPGSPRFTSRNSACRALLGELSPALIAALYGKFVDRSVFLVHVGNGVVDGFVVGGAAREVFNCRLSFVRHCGLRCILDVLRRPRIWLLAFRSFAKLVGKLLPSKSRAAFNEEFHLLSIAVAVDAERAGIGTQLVRRFEEAIIGSCRTYRLGVLKNNLAAIRFYEKLGFRYAGESVTSWTLSKSLTANAGSHEMRAP